MALAALLVFSIGVLVGSRARLWPASRWGEFGARIVAIAAATLAAGSVSYPVGWVVVAFLCGGAIGPRSLLAAPSFRPARWRLAPLELLFIVSWLFVRFAPTGVAAALAGCAAGVALGSGARRGPPVRGRAFGSFWPAVSIMTLVFVGVTNPALSWLGPVTSHGPSNAHQVAITFDDGPNSAATNAVLQELAERHVPATFFLVGKAVDREPEMVPRILAAGHLIGDHSYHHDGWRYIQPTYPELGKGEDAILRAANVCPRYYRPPHGTHTPFVWLAAERHDMRLVNWSVSAADWSATDPDLLARRIVERAKGGSIILLHDGIDGQPNVNRDVVIAALPKIIDGLRARGLEPVRLDTLLGGEGMRVDCHN